MKYDKAARAILLHGLALIMAGLLWGLVVPKTPFPRLALTAHIQFMVNGMLLMIQALLLLKLPHNVGPKAAATMLASAWLTWPIILSEVANSWWGTKQTLPIAAGHAGATGGAGWQEAILFATHFGGGVVLIVAWGLLLAGFARAPKNESAG